ncbi:MAG: MBL fold metallo-hydrolase [Lachnospiraceae bacterium]|nr:MBL fold metallo-hydrolase [Lachnospiraceae bacterium]
MLLEFLGAAHEVTGSCHYMKFGDRSMIVDCGMEQGPDLYESQHIPVNAASIDYVFITHAHIDHSGLLPLLYSHGFRGKIYATHATCELCEIMLRDSAHIQIQEADWKNRKAKRSGRAEVTPIYDLSDVAGVLRLFEPCRYGELLTIDDTLKARFSDAGHLLGSASIEFFVQEDGEETKIIFSGDLGNGQRPLIKDPAQLPGADYVVIESTYGDRLHNLAPDYAEELADVIRSTFLRGGNLVIPAFSVGRTQEMLYYLRRIKSEQLLPEYQDFEVYIDSPLAVEATNIFQNNDEECFDEEALSLLAKGINPIRFRGLHTAITSEESIAINFLKKPVVIISASGMCEAGRIRHHLKHNLWRPESTILFVGFQVPGTLGNTLLSGAKEVRLFGETIEVCAEIKQLPGMSGHADRDHLSAWLSAMEQKPKKVFVVHGDDTTCEAFATHLNGLGYDAYAPYSGDLFDLATGMMIKVGNHEKRQRKPSEKASSNVFARLLAAGKRLMEVIRRNEGIPNKELAKFADQINALSEKWDR